MDWPIYINVGTAVAVIVYIIRGTWHARGIETSIREYLNAHIENMKRDIAKIEREGVQQIDVLRREIGETGHALRTKMHEMETWNRDNFVRTEIFDKAVNRIEEAMEKGFDKVDDRLTEALRVFNGRSG
jgi:hypothetical protein